MRADQILPDDVDHVEAAGVTVRKGTVAAFLQNARIWCEPSTGEAERAEAERDIGEAVPALRAIGFFEVLAVRNPELAALVAARQSPRA